MRRTVLALVTWGLSYSLPPAASAQEGGSAGPEPPVPSALEPPKAEDDAHEGQETLAWLGVAVDEVDELVSDQLGLKPHTGLMVEAVVPGSPADENGIQRHDILTRLDDQLLVVPRQLEILLHMRAPRTPVQITCVRKGHTFRIPVVLGERRLKRRNDASEPPSRFLVEAEEFDNENLRVSLRTREHTVVVESRPDGNRYATATRNHDGKVLFEGLVTTESQRENLPDAIRAKIEKLGAMENGKWTWQFDLNAEKQRSEDISTEQPETGEGQKKVKIE